MSAPTLVELVTLDHPPSVRWQTDVPEAPVAVASASSGAVAVAGAEGVTHVLDGASGDRLAQVDLPGGALVAAWAPGGAVLAVGGPLGVVLWERRTRQVCRLDTGVWCGALAWADPHRLAVGAGRRAHVRTAQGELLWATSEVPSTVTGVAWLHGGRRLAVAAYGGVSCFLPGRRGPVADYRYAGSVLSLAASPSERWLCTGNHDASIHVWRVRDGEELEMGGYPQKMGAVAFDDSGRWLAATGAPEVTVWDFAGRGPAGSAPRVLQCHDAIGSLAWQPGLQAILASGGTEGTVALWQPAAGRPQRPQSPRTRWSAPAAVTALGWSAPGRLVVADRAGGITALDVA